MHTNCRQCTTGFEVTEEDLKFYDKVSPVFAEKKYQIPPPLLCPECRFQRRISFRNEWKFYNATCPLCRKEMISLYAPANNNTVYCQECWWSDAYDPLEFGMEYDPTQSFISQYKKLFSHVPKLAIHNTMSENSIYTNYSHGNKNCYLLAGSGENEDCLYSYRIFGTQKSMDTYNLFHCVFCYECMQCSDLYNCSFCRDCKNSSDLILCEDCTGCKNCFGCVNLRNKEYCLFNQQLSAEDYALQLRKYLDDFINAKITFEQFRMQQPFRNLYILNCETVTGDQLINCKNCKDCYSIQDSQDCKYCFIGVNKDSHDCNFGDKNELMYNSTNLTLDYHVICGNLVWYTRDSYYNSVCFYGENLFGCAGIKKGKYCILNKQYTKEEYEILVPKIIERMVADGEWGEFFDPSISPFGYNETVAMDYFPLTRDAALRAGFNWSDFEPPRPEVKKIIPASKLPDNIRDIPDDILNWAIECEVTKKPFRIIKQELHFYREHNLPIPRRHPDQRHKDRLALRNPRKLWDRNCMKCNTTIQTTYSPDRKELVYCETCYLKEIY